MSIQYTRESVGEEIHIEIKIRDKFYSSDKIIKPNTTLPISEPIIEFETPPETFHENISIKIVEDDLIFDDVGETDSVLRIDAANLPQVFKFEVKVSERGTNFRKATAAFIVTLSADKVKRIPSVDDPNWTGNFNDDTEQMILARVIWGETRGASRAVRIAVGCSIRNRLGTKGKKGLRNSYHKIILESSQYSVFWEKSPKDKNLKALRDPLGTTENPADNEKWKDIYFIAGQVINEDIPDPTKGANHYYSKIKKNYKPPYWATKKTFTVKIDNTYFYRL